MNVREVFERKGMHAWSISILPPLGVDCFDKFRSVFLPLTPRDGLKSVRARARGLGVRAWRSRRSGRLDATAGPGFGNWGVFPIYLVRVAVGKLETNKSTSI